VPPDKQKRTVLNTVEKKWGILACRFDVTKMNVVILNAQLCLQNIESGSTQSLKCRITHQACGYLPIPLFRCRQ